MIIYLPWYPKELSPNARNHWATKAKYKKLYRTACWAATKEVCKGINLPDGKIDVLIEFFPPSKRHYDLDNCLASIKSGLDGVADALLVNDKRFALTVKMREDKLGMVKITIEENNENIYIGLLNGSDNRNGG